MMSFEAQGSLLTTLSVLGLHCGDEVSHTAGGAHCTADRGELNIVEVGLQGVVGVYLEDKSAGWRDLVAQEA